jgi:hypothetical protein
VAENAATFDSIAASIPEGSPVGVVGWGGGGLFRSTVESVSELPVITARKEIAAIRYFGDLDVEGLRIPIAASAAAEQAGLPPVRPAVGLYARLLAVGRPQPATPVAPEIAAELTSWLGPALAPEATALLVSGHRLAQEAVGLDRLVENDLWATQAGLGPGRSGTPTAIPGLAVPTLMRKPPAALGGDLALTHDDDGREVVPTTEAEWADWVPAARTRNWVLGDPLLDWLHTHGSEHGFVRDDERPGYDPRTDFQRFVREKGIAFEAGVLRLVEARVPVRVVARASGDGRSLEKARETFEVLQQGVPVVAQAVLRNPESRTFGVADLLVRSDVLATWFPELLSWKDATVGAPGLGHMRFHYRAIDIKFHTLGLAADGHIAASVDQLAHAVEVWIHANALARLQGYIPPAAYLLGRAWQRGDERGAGCLDRLARVDIDRWLASREMSLLNLVRLATAWIRRLRAEGHQWHVFPEPSVPDLYPHARNHEDAPWHAAKREIAEGLGELTLLPAMNPERRTMAHAAGYRRWTDPGVSAAILGVTSAAYAARIDAVLEANRQAAPTAIPHRITKADPVWRDIRPVEFFVDFETVSNLDDDLVRLPGVGGQPQIVQVGCGHLDGAGCWVFAQWTADALDVGEERRILDAWFCHMANVCRAAGVTLVDARICHWSAAEPVNLESAYNSARTRHPGGDWPAEMPWFDVLQHLIRAEPVAITGAFNFGLKAIAKAMHDAGFIQTTWRDGPADGLGAMTATWSAAREAVASALPLSKHELIVEIGHYNEVDCRVMAEILQWLRANR